MNQSEPPIKLFRVDFSAIPSNQKEINERLEEWAKWVRVKPQAWATHPMFRQYRSKAWQWEMPVVQIPVNIIHALEVEKAVSALPEKHRDAIRWAYVFAYIPDNVIRRSLGLTREDLAKVIINGRSMLNNTILVKKQQISVDI